MRSIGYGAYNNYGEAEIPLPPPPCTVCGTRHAHFVHSSPTYIRGAGRQSLSRPHTPYKIHMTPREMDCMIYGPMFEQMMRKRGASCACSPRSWDHPPYTPLTNVEPIEVAFGELKSIDYKTFALLALGGYLLYKRLSM